jgi:four helix bundle protein
MSNVEYGMKENIIKDKSLQFAIRIVNLYKYLVKEKNEFVMSKQILRCGTSIGANCREGDFAESKLDFIHKFAIAQKECNETIYWLELLLATKYISETEFTSISTDAIEIMKLLTSIIVSSKKNIND